ncbi:MAG: archease [Candidatus Woesearchaeota archaeon]
MAYNYSYIDIVSADVAFIAEADTVNELFVASAKATFQVMTDIDKIEQKEKFNVSLENKDAGKLLIDFLSELLFLKDTEGIVFSEFDVQVTDDNGVFRLIAAAFGEKIDYEKKEYKTDVKAVTYHQFMFEHDEKSGKWKAQVVLDI